MAGKNNLFLVVTKLARLVAVVLFFAVQFFGLCNLRAAAATASWVDGDMPKVVMGDAASSTANINYPCDTQKFRYLGFFDENGSYSSTPRELETTACMTHNTVGDFGGGYIKLGSYGYYTKDYNRAATLVAVPNQRSIVWLSPADNGYGVTVRFVTNLATFGTPRPVNLGTSRQVMGVDIIQPSPYPLLKDGAGNPLRINAYNFSSSGEWMIAEAVDLGVVRINTIDQTMQLIGTEHYAYLQGYLPQLTLAISDDGNYVIKSGKDVGPTTVYDLTACQRGYFAVNGIDNSDATRGCHSRVTQASLDAQLGSSSAWLLAMQFVGDSQNISARAAYRKNDGTYQVRSVNYMVAGYSLPHADYIALGDSFSSGEGAYDYEPGTDVEENKCHLSTKSYPYLLSEKQGILDFHSVACSGAKLNDVVFGGLDSDYNRQAKISNPEAITNWLPGYLPQKKFIKYLPGVITVSIGGNDVGFAKKLSACVGFGTCSYASDPQERVNVAREIAGQYSSLSNAYGEIVKASDMKAKVYVVGYPLIVSNGTCASNVHLNGDEIQFVREATHYLNQVAKAAADSVGVYFLDIEHSLDNYNLCSSADKRDMGVNGLTNGDDNAAVPWYMGFGSAGSAVITAGIGNESYHPNAQGHRRMADAINSLTQNSLAAFDVCPGQPAGVVVCPRGDNKVPVPNEAYFGTKATNYVNWLNTPATVRVDTSPAPQGRNIILDPEQSSSQVRIFVQDLKPNSTISVVAHSTPTVLGTYTVSSDGTLDVSVDVSSIASVEPGNHTIHVLGQNVAGEAVDYYEPVLVTGPTGDLDGDGVADEVDPCGFVDASGEDVDHDGIDDACDGTISEADTTAPVVSGVAQSRPNENGWYNADVTVDWSSIDADPGSGAPTQPIATVATEDGEHTYTSEQSCDPAGNCATGSVTLKIDKTKPIISYTTSGPPNENGWYRNDVTIRFECSDATSGIAQCTEPITVGTDGGHQQITGTATDNAGNTQTVTLDVSQDKTAPIIDFTLDQSPNAQGWNNGPVTVTFHCSDDTSKIATCSPPQTITDEGGMIVTGTATDNAGNTASINAIILIDRSLPGITYSTAPAPNSAGWNNSDVTVEFSCDDVLSKILSCTNSVIISDEGANREVTGEAVDNAANENKTIARINIDKTAPVLGVPVWSSNTKSIAETASITIPTVDSISGVEEAEYFIGDTDPGRGNGATMTIGGGNLTTVFGTDFPTGVYKITVRAKDWAGNWSAQVSDYLVVYNPDGPRMTGRKAVLPSLAAGDRLPGLMAVDQNDKATFGFSVKYDSLGQISRNSDFEFKYSTGLNCHNLLKASNCHRIDLNATTVEWMTTEGHNSSIGVFQGIAVLEVDGARSAAPFRVVGIDGERLSQTSSDQFQLQIFATGSNPNTDVPIYKMNTTAIARGNIKIFDH